MCFFIVLREVTHTQKENVIIIDSIVAFRHKVKKNQPIIHNSNNTDNKEDSKRDIQESNLHGKKKRQDILSKFGT